MAKPMGRLEMHNDTRILIAYLVERVVKEGKDFVSYGELTAAIGGRDVQKEARGLLGTARKILNSEQGVLLEALANEGLVRQRDVGQYLGKVKKHIGRCASRSTAQALSALAADGLDNEGRKKACLELSLLGTIRMMTQPKALKQIEGLVSPDAPKELPTADTLRAQFEGGA